MTKRFFAAMVSGGALVVATGCGGIVGPYPDSASDDAGGPTIIGLPVTVVDASSSVVVDAGSTGDDSDGSAELLDSGVPVPLGDDDDDDDDSGIGDDDSDGGTVIVDAGDPSGGPLFGTIAISAPAAMGNVSSVGHVSARFFDGSDMLTPSTCGITRPSPACTLTVCAAGESIGTGGETPSTEQAGDITVTESNVTNVLMYNGASYGFAVLRNDPYNGKVAVDAAGFAGQVPAFSLVFAEPGNPVPVTPVEMPVGMAGVVEYATTSFPRSSDLKAAWTGGVEGTNVVIDLTTSAKGTSYDLSCTFDQGAGAGVVPSFAGLSALPLVDGITVEGSVSYTWTSSGTTLAGSTMITASVSGRRATRVSFTTTD